MEQQVKLSQLPPYPPVPQGNLQAPQPPAQGNLLQGSVQPPQSIYIPAPGPPAQVGPQSQADAGLAVQPSGPSSSRGFRPDFFVNWANNSGPLDNIKIKKTIKIFPIAFTGTLAYNLNSKLISYKVRLRSRPRSRTAQTHNSWPTNRRLTTAQDIVQHSVYEPAQVCVCVCVCVCVGVCVCAAQL